MRSVRALLVQGNRKVGSAIHHFDLPAIGTCPGSSELCRRVCYAQSGRYLLRMVQERLDWCYQQALKPGFADRLVSEIRRKGCLVVRAHCSGDFFSKKYAEAWERVMRRCPRVKFYFYTRSWRVPVIAAVLERMAALKNVRAWYSIDAETGVPLKVPRGVRLAYLMVDEEERPELADLFFRVRRLRRKRIPLSLACPSETPEGHSREVNCGNCQRCWC